LGGELQQNGIIPEMTQPSVAVVAQHPTDSPSIMVMVDNEWFLRPTNNTLVGSRLDMLQILIADRVAELTPTNIVAIRRPASPAPAIKAGFGSVMQGEILGIHRLNFTAPGAGFGQCLHVSSPTSAVTKPS
jgi:hypothetical protein